jgi:hypothetical protein
LFEKAFFEKIQKVLFRTFELELKIICSVIPGDFDAAACFVNARRGTWCMGTPCKKVDHV